MNIRKTSLGLPAVLLATMMFSGCQNTAKGLQQDTDNNAEKAKAASQDAANETARATQDMKQDMKEAAQATADATKTAAEKTAEATKKVAASTVAAVDGAAQTMMIKTALMADKSVEAGNINVDTDGTTKVVTLKGSVPTVAQKATAGRIAREKAPATFRIVNNLVVKP
jgi:osmotically-inducible protein OsmY